LYRVFIVIDKKGLVSNLGKAAEILVIDADSKAIIARLQNPITLDPSVLEEYIEEYEPILLITSSIDQNYAEIYEENGVKIYSVRPLHYNRILEEIFGFQV